MLMLIHARFSKPTIPQILAILCIANIIFSSTITGNITLNLKTGDIVEYTIIDASETINFFYGAWPPGDYYGNWTVSQNEKIAYEITNDTVAEIEGGLVLGNYTFNNIRVLVSNIF